MSIWTDVDQWSSGVYTTTVNLQDQRHLVPLQLISPGRCRDLELVDRVKVGVVGGGVRPAAVPPEDEHRLCGRVRHDAVVVYGHRCARELVPSVGECVVDPGLVLALHAGRVGGSAVQYHLPVHGRNRVVQARHGGGVAAGLQEAPRAVLRPEDPHVAQQGLGAEAPAGAAGDDEPVLLGQLRGRVALPPPRPLLPRLRNHLEPVVLLCVPSPEVALVGASVNPDGVLDGHCAVQVPLAGAVGVPSGPRLELLPRLVSQAEPPKVVELHLQLESRLSVNACATIGPAVYVQIASMDRQGVAVTSVGAGTIGSTTEGHDLTPLVRRSEGKPPRIVPPGR
mmetsp:Transcript_27380/g.59837  ORF Transcript_27380/g.59837 Transcript_27380/m.59837 type:complete len:338 (-) Transcript_27380:399-1412(-)